MWSCIFCKYRYDTKPDVAKQLDIEGLLGGAKGESKGVQSDLVRCWAVSKVVLSKLLNITKDEYVTCSYFDDINVNIHNNVCFSFFAHCSPPLLCPGGLTLIPML
jgi:hypothetical protein